jgi:ABC-2 type transport system permease protein
MKIVRDTSLIFRDQVALAVRSPVWLILGAVQPIISLALFGPLLNSLTGGPGPLSVLESLRT